MTDKVYSHDELMKVLAWLAEYGYCSSQGVVKALVDKSFAELEHPPHYSNYQYATPTNKGLIELGEWILEE